jgi:para-nitrobenzyl esterase
MSPPRPLPAALVAALALGAAAEPGWARERAVVAVTGGAVSGERQGQGAVFLGVPFARPPIGDLRWRPPQPLRWTGERAASAAGPACLQAPLGWNDKDAARSSEDCLYLDVSTPALDATARRPVMVWIHGGANWAGSGDGVVRSRLARQGVVVVSVQYRLGVFGFLSHPALTAEGGGASGNYALMDLVAALRWVRTNIAAFGGDPDNVTLFGHSAGAQDVGLLLVSPSSQGLFAKAVEQSGTAG